MSNENEVEDLRCRIDELDSSILELINSRLELAQAIGKKKASDGRVVYRPEREAMILNKLCQINKGPLSNSQLKKLFREIISISRNTESQLKVATLGPKGTFSEQATYKLFGQYIETVPTDSIVDVFRATESGITEFGVVPVENSTEGGINITLDLLIETNLLICNEIELNINHCLLANPQLVQPDVILGHEQALAQCRKWLAENYQGIPIETTRSTAEGAKRASKENNSLAVGSELLAEVYDLVIKQRDIEDQRGNKTRFLVISKQKASRSGNDKTSLIVANPDQAGALHSLLKPFADENISMTRIESRPMPSGLWKYLFFIDIEGHIEDENIQRAIATIQKEAAFFKVAGSYPRG